MDSAASYDVLVIGGGHAGAEAAWAAARMGARTALITMRIEAVGRMSCNPAIGGIGKGQMVNEIDALGGLMGLATDAAGIQFRMLNRRKGPAVWSPRAQADRGLYAAVVQRLLGECSGLDLIEGTVEQILTEAGSGGGVPRVLGVVLNGSRRLKAPIAILTTGTFMRGLMHCGEAQTAGGRVGEAASTGLSAQLLDLGFVLGRLKTGTPPRIHRDSIDFDRLEAQAGDEQPTPFSFMTERITQPQIQCHITYTNPQVHELIRENLHRAPMYSGQIKCRGVRYCPSIEDKVVRFADKDRHQIFLEPEGYDDERIYCNGLGTSLPSEVQEAFVRHLPGLENARIVQMGYAVEYDFVPTHQTQFTLETKLIEGLFLAGQINGTSGYEEAAGQGLLAGINAVRKLQGRAPVILGRDQAYIGVMIDDLITRPPDEPYRMFTSRAEYRLHLRSDNADARLTPMGREIGLVDDARWARYSAKAQQVRALWAALDASVEGQTLRQRLSRPDLSFGDVAPLLDSTILSAAGPDARRQVEIQAKYSGYLDRMNREVDRLKRLETCRIPVDLQFAAIPALRHEAREKLTAVRPLTLGQASRVSGITPADIGVLWIAITARSRAATA